jgi:hypothetical protein
MRALERLVREGHLFLNDILSFEYRGRIVYGEVCIPGLIRAADGQRHVTLSKWVAADIHRYFHTKPRYSAWDNVYVRARGLAMRDLRSPAPLTGTPYDRWISSYFAPRLCTS